MNEGVRVLRYALEVMNGPSAGESFPLEGTVTVGAHEGASIRLTDPTVSRLHAELQVRRDGVRVRDLGSTNGTFVSGTRIIEAVLAPEAILGLGKVLARISVEEEEASVPPYDATAFGDAVGQSSTMRRVFGVLDRVANSESSVVLLGETGTGKDLLARAVHSRSPRGDRPFVVVDCGAIAPSLIESQLFGHVRGAFTGAIESRSGAFADADGGTLFLDEVGELLPALQPKLLRVLEAGKVKPLGSDAERDVNVRVLAATHRDLDAAVKAKQFREDLYFRLAVVVVEVPPLRARREDIPLLVETILARMGREQVALSPALITELTAHDWPGNVRELRNVVERALAGVPIALEDKAREATPEVEVLKGLPFKAAKDRLVDGFTREYLRALLDTHGGNVSEVARRSGLARNYVHGLIKRYGLR
ncbi:MAG: sigma 54-interacting transcriptional regulator [Myxococcaceae bacterium]